MAHKMGERRFILKLNSSQLKEAKWDLHIDIDEARDKDCVVALFSSEAIRFIEAQNGVKNVDFLAKNIRKSIKNLKKGPNSVKNSKIIANLYKKLDETLFLSDYLAVIMDNVSDYRRLLKGFKVNGQKFKRAVGTSNGVKNSTIIFVSERVYDALDAKLEADRDKDMELVPAKFEAYKGLAFSASTPVSFPNGIAVVNDCLTKFTSDYVSIKDDDDPDKLEPVREFVENGIIELNACDGCGMMLPSLAERWSRELGLDYVMSGCNTRYVFSKGMVYTFDFRDFAKSVADKDIIIDAWGNEVNINNVELILTTSMVKLWDSYSSCEDYIRSAQKYGYNFGVCKVCPEFLEDEHTLNYQFIQSYELSDKDIDELIAPTVNEIHDILHGDWAKTVLYLKGKNLDDKAVLAANNDYIKALMAEHRMLNDPYVRSKVHYAVRKTIQDAKIGVLKVHGNYSMVSGDLYALCQSMFGLEVTGLLGAGEIYNQYWADRNTERLICFRAPMTNHANILSMRPSNKDDVRYWYRYMTTCVVFNAWDLSFAALNGADCDGDIVMLTDNPVLLRRHRPLPAIMCEQKKAEKVVITEDALIKANIDSFGDEIGKVTNRITSMFDVISEFERGGAEYEELMYRIECGQHEQQAAIDRTKGILAKKMPPYWYTLRGQKGVSEFCKRIVADKKPYFMIYIYPSLKRDWKRFLDSMECGTYIATGKSLHELLSADPATLNDNEAECVRQYYKYAPVSLNNSVMNRICRKIEAEFDGILPKLKREYQFDRTIMQTGEQYSQYKYYQIKMIYDDFMKEYGRRVKTVKSDYSLKPKEQVRMLTFDQATWCENLRRTCFQCCSNAAMLNDILVDLCYTKEKSKNMLWEIAPDVLIEVMLRNNDGKFEYPAKNESGDIIFGGERFDIKTVTPPKSKDYKETVDSEI